MKSTCLLQLFNVPNVIPLLRKYLRKYLSIILKTLRILYWKTTGSIKFYLRKGILKLFSEHASRKGVPLWKTTGFRIIHANCSLKLLCSSDDSQKTSLKTSTVPGTDKSIAFCKQIQHRAPPPKLLVHAFYRQNKLTSQNWMARKIVRFTHK